MTAPICVTCGRPESQHTGPERFCGTYATFRSTPAPAVAPSAREWSEAERVHFRKIISELREMGRGIA